MRHKPTVKWRTVLLHSHLIQPFLNCLNAVESLIFFLSGFVWLAFIGFFIGGSLSLFLFPNELFPFVILYNLLKGTDDGFDARVTEIIFFLCSHHSRQVFVYPQQFGSLVYFEFVHKLLILFFKLFVCSVAFEFDYVEKELLFVHLNLNELRNQTIEPNPHFVELLYQLQSLNHQSFAVCWCHSDLFQVHWLCQHFPTVVDHSHVLPLVFGDHEYFIDPLLLLADDLFQPMHVQRIVELV